MITLTFGAEHARVLCNLPADTTELIYWDSHCIADLECAGLVQYEQWDDDEGAWIELTTPGIAAKQMLLAAPNGIDGKTGKPRAATYEPVEAGEGA